MNSQTQPLTFTVPLTSSAYRLAEQFQRQQTNPTQAKQVYLNTLAVYAVNFYLQCLDIETDWDKSDSWDTVMQTFMDIADLKVKNLGKLECRPILPDERVCYIPSEVWSNRIGCVAVQINESTREATLLGFTPFLGGENPPDFLPIADFKSLDNLINRLKEGIAFLESRDPVAVEVQKVLGNTHISEIVAQLEVVYRICPEYQWSYATEKVLSGTVTPVTTDRESLDSEEIGIELYELAETVMEKLASIWENIG
jgi:Protein of unknown function (DUF1822)